MQADCIVLVSSSLFVYFVARHLLRLVYTPLLFFTDISTVRECSRKFAVLFAHGNLRYPTYLKLRLSRSTPYHVISLKSVFGVK